MAHEARNRSLFWLGLFSLAGLALSVVAVYEHELVKAGLSGSLFCHLGKTFNCEAAIKSGYSELFGVPLASYGMVFYPALLGLAILAADSRLIPKKIAASLLFAGGVFAAFLSIVLFLVLQFAVRVYCPVCITTYLANFGLLGSAWWFSREFGIGAKFAELVRGVVRFPALLVGAGEYKESPSRWLARFALLPFAFLIFVAHSFPTYVMVRFLLDDTVELGPDQIVAAWEAAPVQEISYSPEGGLTRDYSKGSPNAPVKVVEFSDFECPACRATFPVLDALLQEYQDEVFFVYRNFPLDQACNPLIDKPFHRNACFAANFARCAGEQGKFWEASDFLVALNAFDTHDPKRVKGEIMKGSRFLELDETAMQECVSSGRQLEKIKQDVAEAQRLEAAGTPAIWVNGRKVEPLSEDGLRAIFDKLLGKKQL